MFAWRSLPFVKALESEFAGYSRGTLRRDVLAGLTVGAVALPLALAFGVASGADAAAGVVTAIIAGVVIALFGGAAFQISGPTGAMSAILIGLSARYGLAGVWAASLMAGVFLLLLGLFRFGRYIAFIPTPVITGFTSGIALIIAIGQIDEVLGVPAPHAEGSLGALWAFISHPPTPDLRALALALIVAASMILLPKLTKAVPGSLVGIALATLVSAAAGWDVKSIGSIPSTILLDSRLSFGSIPWANMGDLLMPAISIAALAAIESLLCASVGATMTGQPIDSNQELIGQGIGNIIIPFFGGVPATAAIARTSVGIKSGGQTRVVSLVHAVVLLLSALVLGQVIGKIPVAALGGVLMVTAWRMNEWEALRFFAKARIKHALIGVIVTMLATVALDLTQAILIGISISALIYLRQSARSLEVSVEPVDPERLRARGVKLGAKSEQIAVMYLTGPIFFGSVTMMMDALRQSHSQGVMILSMRGVPLIDVMGVQALERVVHEQRAHGGDVFLSGVQPNVHEMLGRTGLLKELGENHLFWSADLAIAAACGQYQTA